MKTLMDHPLEYVLWTVAAVSAMVGLRMVVVAASAAREVARDRARRKQQEQGRIGRHG